MTTRPNNHFGALLKQHLQARQLNQSQAGANAGFDHSYFSRLISGARDPSYEATQRIADMLDLQGAARRAFFMAARFLPDDSQLESDPVIANLRIALAIVEETPEGAAWASAVRDQLAATAEIAFATSDSLKRFYGKESKCNAAHAS